MTIKDFYRLFDQGSYIKPIDCDSLSNELNVLKGQLKGKVTHDYSQIVTKHHLIGKIDELRAYLREFRNICLDDSKRKWSLYEDIRKSLEDLIEKLEGVQCFQNSK